MKKALIIVAVILVLAGIGAAKNKAGAKNAAAAETRAVVTETVAPVETAKPTAKPTPKPTPTPELQALEAAPVATEEPVTRSAPTKDYVLNMNTMKFHKPTCSSVKDIKASNRWDFNGTRDEVIEMGYAPCKKCNP